MAQINVTFDCIVPDDATDEEIKEWLEFNLNACGHMPSGNSLTGCEIEAVSHSIDFQD